MTEPNRMAAIFKHPGRLEAFSDGVFAIAITLLILEIRVPSVDDAGSPALLLRALLTRWPSYFAFLLSFLTIYVGWIGHHLMLQRVKVVTLPLVWANALFRLFITFLPFPTALVAEHLTHPSGTVAAALYAATNAVNSLTYLNLYSVTSQQDDPDGHMRYARLNAILGVVVCLACVGLAFVSPLLVAAVWLWWSLPQKR